MKQRVFHLASATVISFILLIGTCAAKATSTSQNEISATQLLALKDKWQIAFYTLDNKKEKIKALRQLEKQASEIVARYPEETEPKLWWGIILSSEASLIRNISVLKKAEQSRDLFLEVINTNPEIMGGAAYTMLGTLYHQLPGWPFAYGDDKKAEQYFIKALKVNPDNMNSNFQYASFLADNKRYKDALVYITQAERSKARKGYELADQKTQQDIIILKTNIIKHLYK